jgi:hypothetical protein
MAEQCAGKGKVRGYGSQYDGMEGGFGELVGGGLLVPCRKVGLMEEGGET